MLAVHYVDLICLLAAASDCTECLRKRFTLLQSDVDSTTCTCDGQNCEFDQLHAFAHFTMRVNGSSWPTLIERDADMRVTVCVYVSEGAIVCVHAYV